MELSSCVSQIIHRDQTLRELIINQSCLTACAICFEPDDEDYHDRNDNDDIVSVRAKEINRIISDLNLEVSGSREWYTILGEMIAKLPNLIHITIDGVDPESSDLEGFWGEVSGSQSLADITFSNMNLESCEEVYATINAPKVQNIVFHNCFLPNDLGFILNDNLHHGSLSSLRFDTCHFGNTRTIREILDFAAGLALIPSISNVLFISCSFDAEQSICLKRIFQEERLKLGMSIVSVNVESQRGCEQFHP